MLANIFTTVIVQPIFNLLVVIYALLPGHNFGMSIIIFTIIVRMLLWPLVKRQINHAKAMRELAPELKKIKASAKGDRQKESKLTMELYKEREINPFASIGILIVQLPILIGLYSGLSRIIKDPHQIVTFSYPFVQHLSWIQTLSHDISKFDDTFLGIIDLSRKAIDSAGIYWPALLIVAASAAAQYFQSKQLMPKSEDSRSLRQILREAGQGKQAEQSEVNAAVGRGTIVLIPGMVFIFGLNFAAALPLYWLSTSVIAYIQQARILKDDVDEADKSVVKTKGVSAKTKPAPEPTITKSGLKVTRLTVNSSGKSANQKSSKTKRANRRKRK
jgi:YidC/Oxa1 family membrane protein insertase